MKKTMKSIIAATLALVMLLCSVPAFAALPEETVKWYDTWTISNKYHYAGELKEGETRFDKDIPDSVYYTFDVSEEGFYMLTRENGWLAFFEPEEIKDDGYYGEKYGDVDIGIIKETGLFADLYYLEEGQHIFGVTYGEGTASPTSLAECGGFSFEYCGKEVVDLEFDEYALDDYIIDSIRWDEYSGVESGYSYYLYMNGVTLVFETGKKVTVGRTAFSLISQEALKEGKNDFTIRFLDYKEDITINAYPLSHFIESAELSNVEKNLDVMFYYDGSAKYNEYFEGEYITVTFTDGTKKKCLINEYNYAEIEFDNGRVYDIDVGYASKFDDPKNPECFVYIQFSNDDIIGWYECNVKTASLKENIEWLRYNIDRGTYWEIERIKNAFIEIFLFDSALELMNNINDFVSVFIGNATEILDCVNEEIDAFAEYLA
ncbi:MAG: hypothetical protein IJO03_09830 [Clostridia bacterium]|nr:hypothetical protein [Clostridia bacterium]